jgi:hypothetical protein
MPTETEVQEAQNRADTTREHSFDELAKGLASSPLRSVGRRILQARVGDLLTSIPVVSGLARSWWCPSGKWCGGRLISDCCPDASMVCTPEIPAQCVCPGAGQLCPGTGKCQEHIIPCPERMIRNWNCTTCACPKKTIYCGIDTCCVPLAEVCCEGASHSACCDALDERCCKGLHEGRCCQTNETCCAGHNKTECCGPSHYCCVKSGHCCPSNSHCCWRNEYVGGSPYTWVGAAPFACCKSDETCDFSAGVCKKVVPP